MWFRVELNRDGSVLSCREVEAQLPGEGRHVYYIDAQLKQYAIGSAQQRYERYKARQRESVQERRNKRREQSLCPECGAATSGGVWCEGCLERKRGLRAGSVKPGKQGVIAARVQEMKLGAAGKSQRVAILEQVLDAAVSMRAGIAFISWLRGELEAARNGRAEAAE
jgi:hypothetical protein